MAPPKKWTVNEEKYVEDNYLFSDTKIAADMSSIYNKVFTARMVQNKRQRLKTKKSLKKSAGRKKEK